MFAKPIDSGISVVIAKELEVPDPEYTKAMEIINGNSGTVRDDNQSSDESSP